jgi:hypothetical protein
LVEQFVEVRQQFGGVSGDRDGECGQRVAQLRHGGCGPDAVAGDVTDGEDHAAVTGGGGVEPVAADAAGPLGGQVSDGHS